MLAGSSVPLTTGKLDCTCCLYLVIGPTCVRSTFRFQTTIKGDEADSRIVRRGTDA